MAETLKAGALRWWQVAALGIAIAISGNVSGWNYGLGVGGWGGMFIAALAMALLFLCLTQCVAELAAALPDAGGFDGYVRRALGPAAAYLTGMSVAIALAVGAGLAASFGEAYVSAWLGIGGWPVKLAFLFFVMGLQLRGAGEAVGLTVAVGVAALVILVAFCLYMAPEYQTARLYSAAISGGAPTLLPYGLAGAARCIPFALFLFLGVEQAGHAAAEMRDMAKDMPKALATAIGVAFVIGMCVLLIATGGTGADPLGKVDDPLFAAITATPGRPFSVFMTRLVGAGALISLLGTFFSLAYAGSRQFFHLAQAKFLPPVFGTVNKRHAPAAAVFLVGAFALAAAAFPPNSVMVVFIFLISVSHVLLLAAFLRLRRSEPDLPRTYRALGGMPIAALALLLSLSVMVSCYELEVRALQIAIAAIVLLIVQYHFRRSPS